MDSLNRFPEVARIGSITLIAVTLLTAVGLSWSWNPAVAAPAAGKTETHDGHSDAQYEAALRKSMDGPVDIFLDVVEVQEQKPMLASVHFDGLADVTGKHLLVFNDAKNQRWLIDPDAVLAFRVARSKK